MLKKTSTERHKKHRRNGSVEKVEKVEESQALEARSFLWGSGDTHSHTATPPKNVTTCKV